MERLTHERVNGIKTGYWSAATKEVLVQKLAAYENTGYEPDEIRAAIEQAAKSSETKTATVMAECIAGAYISTFTLSPGNMRMKFILSLPEITANIT